MSAENAPLSDENDYIANAIHAAICTEAVDGCDGACDRAAAAVRAAPRCWCGDTVTIQDDGYMCCGTDMFHDPSLPPLGASNPPGTTTGGEG